MLLRDWGSRSQRARNPLLAESKDPAVVAAPEVVRTAVAAVEPPVDAITLHEEHVEEAKRVGDWLHSDKELFVHG